MILDTVPCDIAALAQLFETTDELLLMISIADCAPCAALKADVETALRNHPSIAPLHHLIFGDAAYRDPRVTAMVGRPLTMFPSLLFRTRGHDHWLRGIADKSGPFDAARLAGWFARHHVATGTDMGAART